MWDGVVIIRGGGATSDLAAFENYDLAANIAQFPLPVIIGIGHERDVTRCLTMLPTCVSRPHSSRRMADWPWREALDRLDQLASEIHHTASAMLSGAREQLSYIQRLCRTSRLQLSKIHRGGSTAMRWLFQKPSADVCPAHLAARYDPRSGFQLLHGRLSTDRNRALSQPAGSLMCSRPGHSSPRLFHHPCQRPCSDIGCRYRAGA